MNLAPIVLLKLRNTEMRLGVYVLEGIVLQGGGGGVQITLFARLSGKNIHSAVQSHSHIWGLSRCWKV